MFYNILNRSYLGLRSKQISILGGISAVILFHHRNNKIAADSSFYQFDPREMSDDPYETCEDLYTIYPFPENLPKIDLSKELFKSIRSKNVDDIKFLLQRISRDRFFNRNRNDDNNDFINLLEKSFLQTIENNDIDVFLSLLFYTDNIIKNKALILACSECNLNMIGILVINGADIHTNDDRCFKIAEELNEDKIKTKLLHSADLCKFLNSPDVKFWFR